MNWIETHDDVTEPMLLCVETGTMIRAVGEFTGYRAAWNSTERRLRVSYAAMRSALIDDESPARAAKAEPVEAREACAWPAKTWLEDASFEQLFENYASHWRHDYAANARREILAVANERVARAFEQGRVEGIAAKPKQVVRLRIDYIDYNWKVFTNNCCVAYEARTRETAKTMAEQRVRAINPDAEIVWEDAT